MKEHKYLWVNQAFYDRSGLQRLLERQAEGGWRVERPGVYFWRFRRAAPQKVHAAVTYFPDASEFDPGPTEGQETFRDLCARDGWEFAAQWGQMQIFYHEGKDPTPIETDPVIQAETIRRSMRKQLLPGNLLGIGLSVYLALFILWQFRRDPVNFLASPAQLFYLPFALLLFLSGALGVWTYVVWTRRARVAAERGEEPEFRTHRKASFLVQLLLTACLAGMFLGSRTGRRALLLGIGVVFLVLLTGQVVRRQLKRRGTSRRANFLLSIAAVVLVDLLGLGGMGLLVFETHFLEEEPPVGVYQEHGRSFDVYDADLPLQVEDLMTLPEVDWSREKHGSESFLVAQYDYWQWPLTLSGEIPDLRYQVTDVKCPGLVERCRKELVDLRQDEVRKGERLLTDHYEAIDPAPWGVEEAWQLRWGDPAHPEWMEVYLLCSGSRCVELHWNEPLTQAQQAVIAARLFS